MAKFTAYEAIGATKCQRISTSMWIGGAVLTPHLRCMVKQQYYRMVISYRFQDIWQQWCTVEDIFKQQLANKHDDQQWLKIDTKNKTFFRVNKV